MTISLLLLLLHFTTLFCSENILKEGPIVLEPYFANLTTWAKISASSTCGENKPEVFCLITGGGYNLGHNCSVCDANLPDLSHPVEYAFDGSNRYWKSENFKHNVDISVSFRQEFFIAYVMLVMGPSPPPATWVLEKSTDYGKSYTPLQFFAKNAQDCKYWFGLQPSVAPLSQTDVICTIQNSKMQPQEYGEAYVTLLKDRPGAGNFHSDVVLQNWTRATNLKLRFLQLHTLYGELMQDGFEDNTLKRHYFYSLREIHIGGRCICNGHAKECIGTSGRLVCNCLHNTCGSSCSSCCPGFHQMPWRPATINSSNDCQACNCFGHATNCVYNETVAKLKYSLNMAGEHQGGGVCINCINNTMGINCADCKPGFFRKDHSNLFEKCTECDCDLKGSRSFICATKGGQCPCLPNVQGRRCTSCQEGFWGFPYCKPCDCHEVGSFDFRCHKESGQCPCRPRVAGRRCDFCPIVTRSIFSREGCIECDQCSPLLEQEIKITLEDEVSKELMQMKYFTASAAYNVALDNVYSRFQILNNEMIIMSRPSNPMGSTKRIRNFSTLKPYEVEFLRIQLNQLFFDEFGNFHVRQMASRALKSNIASFKELIRFQLVKEEIHNMYNTIISATSLLNILGEFPQGKIDLSSAIDESEIIMDKCKGISLKINNSLIAVIRESEIADQLLQVGKRFIMTKPNLHHYHTILLSFKLVFADINDWTELVKQIYTNTSKLNYQNRPTLTKIKENIGTILDFHSLSLSSKVLIRDGRLIVRQLSQDNFSEMKVYMGRLKRGIDGFITSLEDQIILFSKNVKPHVENLNTASLETRRKWELELSGHSRFGELLEKLSNISSHTLVAEIIASSSRQLLRKVKQFENVKATNLSRHLYNLSNWPKGNPSSPTTNIISNGVTEKSHTSPKTITDDEHIGSGCDLDDEDQCTFIHDEVVNDVELKNSFPNETKNPPISNYKELFGIIGDEESSEFIGVQSDISFNDDTDSKTGKEHSRLPDFYFADETLQTVAKGFAAASTHFRKKSEQVLDFLGSKWQKFDQIVANIEHIEQYYSKSVEETKAIAQNALSDQPKLHFISNANSQCEQAMDISSRVVRHTLSMTANYRKAASREVIQSIRSKLALNLAENHTIGVENSLKKLVTTVDSLDIHAMHNMFRSVHSKKIILRQRLDEALKIASLFKGAVRVITPGFIVVPISSEAKSSASVFLDINLSVRPNLKNAFIFQFGESSKEETLRIILKGSHFILETEFLGNVTKVIHPYIVSDDWFHVNVKKIGERVSLSISTDCLSPTSVETSFATSVPQQMFFKNKRMYIFGLPPEINKEELGYFNGCLDDVFVNGQEVSLFSPIRSSGKRGVCRIPDESAFCEGKMKLKPMTFQGERDGMHFTAKLLQQNSTSQSTFELDFRTIYSSAFIAQIVTADESSWMKLSLFRGSVLVEFAEMESVRNFSSHNSYYNDGKWHNVKVFRQGGFYQLLVDNQDRKSEVTLHWTLPDYNADIYLGQVKGLNISRKLKWNRTMPFVGCLAHLNLEPSTELIMKDNHVAVHGACQESLWNCVCFEDLSRAIVISKSLSLELQSIRLTFKMINYKGTIVSYSTTVYSNVTVRLDGDSLEVVIRSGKFSKIGLLSLPEAVNDGAWHVFSLLPSRQSVAVTLDDVTLLMDRGLDEPVYKKQHHLIIGMRSLDQRLSLVELRGCLKELAVNNKFVHLGDHVHSSRLGDCSK